MPRAPPTPQTSDSFNLGNLTDSLAVAASAGGVIHHSPQLLPVLAQPTSHPLLNIHISNYIKFQVSTSGDNYTKWRQIIKSLLTMYKAIDHITEGAAPAAPDDTWEAVDIHISLWFLSTLSDDLHRLVQGADGRACSTWTRLQRFFLDRSASRYLYLNKAFHNCPRGDLSATDYAAKLQGLADDLAAIGRPVDDRDLTLAYLDGMSDKFKMQTAILKHAVPSFADACSSLQLEEISDSSQQQHASAQAMVVHGGGRGVPPTGNSAPRPPGYVSPNYRGRNPIPGYVHGQGSATHGASRGQGRGSPAGRGDQHGSRGGNQHPWIGYFAPVGAPLPPRATWVPPNASGVLGPRPGVQTQAYPIMHSPAALPATPPGFQQPPPSAPPAYQAPSWDLNTMHQAAPSYGNAFSTQGGEWIMDSGASTHVTGNQGMLTSSHSPLGLNSSHIVVGNGSRLPVAATGTAHLTTRPFYLRNVLVSPQIIQNLISTRRFSRDNSCSVEFDPFGFSLKDLATKEVLLRSNSSGDLYPFFGDHPSSTATAFSITQDLWHKRLALQEKF
jgi:hypothetical protein